MFAAALALSAALASPVAAASEAEAQRAYAEALELARSGDLRAARSAFERAYRESPHFIVLLNLARVSRDLGEPDDARRYLARYLEEGGTSIAPAERNAALEEIAAIEAELAARAQHSAVAASTSASAVEQPVASGSSAKPEPAAPARGPSRSAPVTAPAPRPSSSELRRAHWTGFSVALASTGAVLAGVGGAVLVSNRSRHEDWEKEDRALAELGPVSVVPGDGGASLAAAQATQRRFDENDALAESIDDSDRVGWIALTSGAVMMATGVVVWLTAGNGPRVIARSRGADLRFSF